MHSPRLSTILEDYLLHLDARHISKHTIADYFNTYRKFSSFVGEDLPFMDITKVQIERFLAAQTVSKKTILNYHTGLSALWTWAVDEGHAIVHLPRQIERPKPEKHKVLSFSDTDLRALFASIGRSQPYVNKGTMCTHSLPNQERNRAILMTLLDCGIRANELVQLKISDLDIRNLRLHISSYSAKGNKERYVPISARTAQVIRKYLATCRLDYSPDEPLFTVETGYPLDRHLLRKTCLAIGRRAGVPNCHPHRFRHTFAISYLRNGGDPWTLQEILGHATMEMIKTYLRIAQNDIATAHRRASPVSNMHL